MLLTQAFRWALIACLLCTFARCFTTTSGSRVAVAARSRSQAAARTQLLPLMQGSKGKDASSCARLSIACGQSRSRVQLFGSRSAATTMVGESATLLRARARKHTQGQPAAVDQKKPNGGDLGHDVGTWRDPADKESRPISQLLPKSLVEMHPAAQVLIAASTLLLHLFVVSKVVIPFPVQTIPNDLGLAHSMALETVLGLGAFVTAGYVRRLQRLPLLPSFQAHNATVPLRRQRTERAATATATTTTKKDPLLKQLGAVLTIFVGLFTLSGATVPLMDQLFKQCLKWGVRVSFPMQRSLHVLVSHLVWVLPGSLVLRLCKGMLSFKARQLGKQLQQSWVWWAVGGYFMSCAVLNVSNMINEFLLPRSVFEQTNTVTEMVDPQANTVASMAVAALAPCLSAPVWEEVIYRTFLLNVLSQRLPIGPAIFVSSLLFAVHHAQFAGLLPLTALGATWTAIYVLSGNLVATIALHMMWNSRVFLGSMLSL